MASPAPHQPIRQFEQLVENGIAAAVVLRPQQGISSFTDTSGMGMQRPRTAWEDLIPDSDVPY
ncbi:hypothetical protein ISE1_2704 [plant metagenome]|uniref:Uncharacterized protein n=1 Tax=plant metagenome TaxID=1297885 RepID=A0A484UI06_9ZZZZ